MLAFLLTFGAVICAQVPAEEAPKRAVRLGLGAVEAHEVSPRLAAVFEDSLLAELRKLARSSVIGMKEIREMLDLAAEKQSLGCDGESATCLAEIADAVGVDVLVLATVATVGDETVVGLKRLDQATAQGANVTKRVPTGNGEEVLALVGPLVAELFPDVPLRAGAVRGVSPEVARRLNPPPLPWFTPFALGAVAVGGLAATGVTAGLWWSAQSRYRELANTKGSVVDGGEMITVASQANTMEPLMWIALGTTTALVLATAVAVPFTDFAGGAE